MLLTRRKMLIGLLAAPAIVKVSSLMSIRGERLQYFPWGIVQDGHVVRLYDQSGNGHDMIAESGHYAYRGPGFVISEQLEPMEAAGLIEDRTVVGWWGTRKMPEELRRLGQHQREYWGF